jgi:hypothetical protein
MLHRPGIAREIRRSMSIKKHFRVCAIATVFGLGAYAVVQVMVRISDRIGLLSWLAR